MRVDIAEALFSDFGNTSMLFSLARFSWEDRHRLFVKEDGSGAFEAWLTAFPEAVRDEWDLVTDLSFRSEALSPSTLSIAVSDAGTTNWDAATATISLPAGLTLLRSIFEIFVENARNDRAFFMAMATPEQRKRLVELERGD